MVRWQETVARRNFHDQRATCAGAEEPPRCSNAVAQAHSHDVLCTRSMLQLTILHLRLGGTEGTGMIMCTSPAATCTCTRSSVVRAENIISRSGTQLEEGCQFTPYHLPERVTRTIDRLGRSPHNHAPCERGITYCHYVHTRNPACQFHMGHLRRPRARGRREQFISIKLPCPIYQLCPPARLRAGAAMRTMMPVEGEISRQRSKHACTRPDAHSAHACPACGCTPDLISASVHVPVASVAAR